MQAPDRETLTAVEKFLRGELSLPARKIKENRIRTVWELSIPGTGTYLVKHYRYLYAYDRMRYRVFPDKARREIENLKRLRQAGLPVPEPYHYGRLEGRSEAFSVSGYLKGSVPWPAEPTAHLVGRLAGIVRELHRARYLHRDLHLGNVVVLSGKPYLLDFHGGFFLPVMPRLLEDRMLGLLVSSFISRGQEHLVGRFFEDYRIDPAGPRAQRIRRAALRNRNRHLKSRARRCVVDSTVFAVERRKGLVVYRLRRLRPEEFEKVLSEAGDLVSANERSAISTVNWGVRRLYRKTVRYGFFRGLLARIAGGKLYAAWRGGNAARVYGIGTAPPVAYAAFTRWGSVRKEVLLTEELTGFVPLTTYLQERTPEELAALAPPLAVGLARFVTAFHKTGFWQHDFAPKNILVRRGKSGQWEFKLVDLDGIRLRGLNERRRLRNLVQLGFVPRVQIRWLDRARFLKAYQGGAYWSREKARILRDGILAEMAKLIIKESRKDMALLLGTETRA